MEGNGFSDLTVLELGAAVTAPYASQILAATGADVVKIEPPGGDPFRGAGVESEGGMSGYFAMCNTGKKSIELDLKEPEGKEIFLSLASEADVVIENYRPAVMERLGIGYETIRSRTRGVVYCSISGYGETGPWIQHPGFDPILQAESGLMSVTGERDGSPVRIGIAMVDLMTAMWGVLMIMNGVRERDRTGESVYIETSMFDVAIASLTKHAAEYFITGNSPKPMGTEDSWTAPYGAYPTRDGRRIMISAPWERLWERLCVAIGAEELLEDDRFDTNANRLAHREELNAELTARFERKDLAAWIQELEGKIPVGPIATVGEALTSEQFEARELRSTLAHPEYGPIDILDLPMMTNGERHRLTTPPPTPGEDGADILRDLGFSAEEIQELRAEDVLL